MKKKISILAIAMFLFTAGANAQEVAKQEKKKVVNETESAEAKTEISPEKKECGTKPKKGACCAHKKEEAKTI
jgi:protein involved in sex pheromone biosynthesis